MGIPQNAARPSTLSTPRVPPLLRGTTVETRSYNETSPPNCCRPAGIQAWEAERRSAQTPKPPRSRRTQNGHVRFSPETRFPSAESQSCHFTIVTTVTFRLQRRRGAFDAAAIKRRFVCTNTKPRLCGSFHVKVWVSGDGEDGERPGGGGAGCLIQTLLRDHRRVQAKRKETHGKQQVHTSEDHTARSHRNRLCDRRINEHR